MTQRLKSWESPRRQGRNDKGKGGSARQRQLKKQQQMLRKKLKGENQAQPERKKEGKRNYALSFLFFGCFPSNRLLLKIFHNREDLKLK
jgi:hypothetical protein